MSRAAKILAIAVVLLVNASGLRSQTPLARFEKQAEELRERLEIPGMSAVIIKDQKVLWAKGFGFADLEKRIPATPDTVYHIASLTKTFAATLILQLVEQGKLDLDEPMSHYSSEFKDDSVRIKHVLSHTADAPPGERFRYDGNRFDHLTAVLEKKTGKPFRTLIVETFLEPLAMSDSVPGHDVVDEADKWGALLGKDNLDRYARDLSRLSRPYTLYGDSDIVHLPYPPKIFGAAAGLLSTVLDMAKYDAALDRHLFLKKPTQEKAWTAFVSNRGERLPYGLGWFVEDHHGIKVILHYGNWTGFSAIHVKVPEKNLSLVMLANSEALSDHQFDSEALSQSGWNSGNNVFACSFLRLFVLEDDACAGKSQTALAKWRENRRKQARTSVRLDPKVLEAYVGQYRMETGTPPDRIYTVIREGDKLFIDIPRDFKSELFAESESRFFLKTRPMQLTFVKAEGQVTHVESVNNVNGQTWKARRMK